MSAGTGVTHSEFNPEQQEVHLLQIWIHPRTARLPPGYEQKHFAAADKRGRLRLDGLDGAEGSVTLHQEARVYAGLFLGPERASFRRRSAARLGEVARGAVTVNGVPLAAGDGARSAGHERLDARCDGAQAEVLLFDLP